MVGMESLQKIGLAALWLTAGCLTGCCLPRSTAQSKPKDDLAIATYLTGSELAQRVLGSIVLIDRSDSQEHGVGLIVGHDASGLIAVTAAHVVRGSAVGIAFGASGANDATLATSVRLRFCSPALAALQVEGRPAPVSSGQVNDIALIHFPFVPGLAPDPKIAANVSAITQGDEAWVAGREGGCAIGGSLGRQDDSRERAAIDEFAAAQPVLRVHLPGGFPGTSGGALLTGRGVVGIVQQVEGGGNLVGAVQLGAVRRASESTLQMTWTLRDSENLPPSSPEAAQRELSDALVRYVFDAQTSHLVLSGTALNKGELSSAVNSYNTAISRYVEVKNKHDGALQRYWGGDVLLDYQAVRSELMALHQTFLDLSIDGYVNEMYRTSVVPDAVRGRMNNLDEPLKRLKVDVDRVVARLAAKPVDQTVASH